MTSQSTRRAKSGAGAPAVSVEELHQRLTAAVAALETGEQWLAWLDFAQRLHRYSFNNLILIWAQCPDASAVASYRAWQALDRQVRRGEKAIRVLAPMIRKTPVKDDHGRPIRRPDGTTEQQERLTGFRPVPVFDISQTDGPPPPSPPAPVLLAGQAPDGLWDALAGEVSERGYRLLRGQVEQLHGANGLTKLAEREVWVRDDVDDAQAAKTLTHELAHIVLHADPDQPLVCAGIREVEAESVAHLVMAAHGVDTAPYTFPYVAAWAHPFAAADEIPLTDVIARTGARVIQTAHTILEAVPVAAAEDPAGAAITVRVTDATAATAELHDRARTAALPPVNRTTLLGVVADSQDFFRRNVPNSWVPGYLTSRRLARAIDSHGIGYAPGGWTVLTDHLRSLGFSDDHIEAAGMATRARTGNLIDRFRDRLTIPLRDTHGDLVGFTARKSPDDEDTWVPKYLNTPTTTIFHKHEILYGLGEHGPTFPFANVPVICEGPLDAIAVDLLAWYETSGWVGMAAVGTAFTADHARQLRAATTTGRICLAFDGDSAGDTATEAAWRQLTNDGPYDVRVAHMPHGADPATMFADEPDFLTASITYSVPAAGIVAHRQIAAAHLDDHAGRELAAFRSLCRYVHRIPVEQRPGYLLDLARQLHIEPADAAALTAEQNPHIVMDRITQHARQLDQMITPTLTCTDGDHSAVNSLDQLGRPTLSR